MMNDPLKEGDKLRRITDSVIWTKGNVYEVVYAWDGHLSGVVRVSDDHCYGTIVMPENLSNWEKVL